MATSKILPNGNISPCPYMDSCINYPAGCSGYSYWCMRYGKPTDDVIETGTYKQMSIFDYMKEQSLETMTIEQVRDELEAKLLLKFEESKQYPGEYVCKLKGGYHMEISFGRYDTGDDRQGKRFIHLDCKNKRGDGSSSPGDSIDEAVNWFTKMLAWIQRDKERLKRERQKETIIS